MFVSAIAALVYDPRTHATDLGFRLQRTYFNRFTVAAILEELVTDLDSDVLVILDNWALHHLMIERLDETNSATAIRITVASFPTYAPDLNPPEQLWTHIEYGQFAYDRPRTIEQLHDRADTPIAER